MKKVNIDIKRIGKYENEYARITVSIDEEELLNGSIGGESEDNTIDRDYAWVDGALFKLATALGAEVSYTFSTSEEEE